MAKWPIINHDYYDRHISTVDSHLDCWDTLLPVERCPETEILSTRWDFTEKELLSISVIRKGGEWEKKIIIKIRETDFLFICFASAFIHEIPRPSNASAIQCSRLFIVSPIQQSQWPARAFETRQTVMTDDNWRMILMILKKLYKLNATNNTLLYLKYLLKNYNNYPKNIIKVRLRVLSPLIGCLSFGGEILINQSVHQTNAPSFIYPFRSPHLPVLWQHQTIAKCRSKAQRSAQGV